MADTKLSALTELTGANVAQTTDLLYIVDVSVTTSKKIIVSELGKALNVLSTEQASTSGTAITFSSIPAGVKKITVMMEGVSTNGSSALLIQIGDSGGLEASGYVGTCTTESGSMTTYDKGFMLGSTLVAAATYTGVFTLYLKDATNFTWIGMGMLARSSAGNLFSSTGVYSLSAELTQIAVTTNTPDTFDAGSINIQYSW